MVEGRLSESDLFALVNFVSANPTRATSSQELVALANFAGAHRAAASRVAHASSPIGTYLKNERANLSRAEVNDFKTLCKEIADEHR